MGERMAFHSDPIGGDGIIVDTKIGETWPTEHILVPMSRTASVPDVEASIAKAVTDKQKKGGAAYGLCDRKDLGRVPQRIPPLRAALFDERDRCRS
ncbi:hypothetical protein [Bradyrhizobium sp. USDA 4508]